MTQSDRHKLDWLSGGGEMAKIIRTIDWSKTPLGPIESWPQSLRTTVSLCLGSNFPINIIWGPEAIQIYNNGYRIVCGEAHPRAMGEAYNVTWASAWPVIGQPFDRAKKGDTSYLENQRMFLHRNGYLEETFFTFSLSPIRDEKGNVVGLFHPVTETTATMLNERRTRALRDIANKASNAETVQEACRLITKTLEEYRLDLPFLLIYLFGNEQNRIQLVGHLGIPEGSKIKTKAGSKRNAGNLDTFSLESTGWPLGQVLKSSQSVLINDVEKLFGVIPGPEYPEGVQRALAMPIKGAGLDRPLGFIVAGQSTRLPMNEAYDSFFEMLGNSISSAISNARAYEEEKKRAKALAEIDIAKTAFFSNVSHEFRTPLTLILGPLEDILAEKRGPLAGPIREETEVIHRNALRLLKLVNTLLDFSRIEADRAQAIYVPSDLPLMTTDLASNFRSVIERAGMNFIVDCESLSEPVYVDPEMWEKIVLNLLSNAFKYTLKGEIRLVLKKRDAKAVELSVTDTGIGIPNHEVAKVFERFHRVQGAFARTHEGTGIGLALVQALVKLHGGAVTVKSVLGKGSTFTVTLPLGSAHVPQDRLSKQQSASNSAAAAPSKTRTSAFVEEALRWIPKSPDALDTNANVTLPTKLPVSKVDTRTATEDNNETQAKKRIVVADDNADMLDYVRRLLADRYEIISASDGKAALEAIQTHRPDLVISDVMMPVMDGIELLRILRADATIRSIPVILLSARAGEESKTSGLESGADDYLVKPFSANELLVRVNTQIKLDGIRKLANQELEQFAYVVSHDLQAPLRHISTYVEILRESLEGPLNKDAVDSMKYIESGCRTMRSLITDLLSMARIGSSALRLKQTDLNTILKEVLVVLSDEISKTQAEIDFDSLPVLNVDGTKISMVFQNLIGNALKYMGNGLQPKIKVKADENEKTWKISVSDNGIGIDAKYYNRIFEIYQRLHKKGEYSGTGIGLSICKKVIDMHLGRIWLESKVGEGSTFYFEIPK
ncbi:MAG: ATP-binding protein [Bdellovibrionia bacterium]